MSSNWSGGGSVYSSTIFPNKITLQGGHPVILCLFSSFFYHYNYETHFQ